MKLLLKFFKKNYIVVILFFVLLFSIYFLNKRFNIIEGLKKSTKAEKAVVSAAASVFGGTLGYSTKDDINNNKNTTCIYYTFLDKSCYLYELLLK